MKKLITAVVLSFSLNALADQNDIDQIEQAFMNNEHQVLESLKTQTQSYDRALISYRLGIAYNYMAQQEKAIEELDFAMELLEQALESDPVDVESLALLAQVYGLKIAYEPMKGAYYGPKAGRALAKATELAPQNPRVQMFAGISKYNTPAMFGGSKQSALDALNQAVAAFPAEATSGNHWGHAEAYVWRGLTQLELGNKDAAVADWQQALAISPDYGWAKFLLSKNG